MQEIRSTSYRLKFSDIFKVSADVIAVGVPGSPHAPPSGLAQEVYLKGGWLKLPEERAKGGYLKPGEVLVTGSGALPCRYVFQTAAPENMNGLYGEDKLLRDCYENCLKKAAELGARSIVFPLIGAGACGFDPIEAYDIATCAIDRTVPELDGGLDVTIAVPDRELYGRLMAFEEHRMDYMEQRYNMLCSKGRDRDMVRPTLNTVYFLTDAERPALYRSFRESEEADELEYQELRREIQRERRKYLSEHPDSTPQDFSREMISEVVRKWCSSPKEKLKDLPWERKKHSSKELAEIISSSPSTVTSLVNCTGRFPSRELLVALAVAMKLDRRARRRFVLLRNEDERYPHTETEEALENILKAYDDIPNYHTVNAKVAARTGRTIRRQIGKLEPGQGRDRE